MKDAPVHHPLDQNIWRDAIQSEDTKYLAGLVSNEFDFRVIHDKQLHETCRCYLSANEDDNRHSEQVWRMIVKNIVINHFCTGRPQPDDDQYTPQMKVALHVGFISIPETEEHIAILTGNADPINFYSYPTISSDENERILDNLARSGIFRTNKFVKPIDRVAARVAHSRDAQ